MPVPRLAALWKMELRISLNSRSRRVSTRRSSLSSLKCPITPSSAVATLTACTAPKNSPIKPVMMPVARLLARRYSSMRLVEAAAMTPTTMNGSSASTV